jgi:hypothetical protein
MWLIEISRIEHGVEDRRALPEDVGRMPRALDLVNPRAHERAEPETDAQPLAFSGTVSDGGFRFRSAQRQERFALMPRHCHLEVVLRDREKATRALAAAPPHALDVDRVRRSLLENE